jgi:lipid II:glycine glycyltransferase (peptidoglycan interpeptide bridge formation enzyme)
VSSHVGAASCADITLSESPHDPEWDAFVDAAPGGHHLQTSLWAQVKAKHGWHPLRLRLQRDGELVGGCQLLLRPLRVGSIAYCPRGPVTRDSDPAAVASLLDALASVARRDRILYIKVQPPVGGSDIEPMLLERGYVASDLSAAPVATVRVDLDRDPGDILARMRASARRNIRQAARKGVVVREAGVAGLPAFGELLAETSRRQHFQPYPLDYYAEILRQFGAHQRAELLLAEYAGNHVSGAVIIGYGDTVIYKIGAWSGRRAQLHPNELTHWHAMQWARERGYRFYDLEGIDESVAVATLAGDELPEEGRRGITRFKLGMGGEVTLYPRAYDRSFHPLLARPVRLLAPRLDRFTALAHRFLGREPSRA